MSAQNETWVEAILGLLGMSPYADEYAGIPDAHGPCCRPPDFDDNTDCDY